MSRTETGARGEAAAARFLESRGWTIVARNFRRREGELDLVASRDGVLAFVEVKTRRSATFGSPAESVTRRKQATIRLLARMFLLESAPAARELRFDVVEVTPTGERTCRIGHIEGAF